MLAGLTPVFVLLAASASPDPQEASQFQLYFFTAAWCGPCRAIYPILDKYKSKEPGCIALTIIDFDQERDVAARFGVDSVPVVLGSELNGRSAFRIDGGGQQELRSLDTALADCIRRCRARR